MSGDDNVTHDQLDNRLVLLHEALKDSNERTDSHIVRVFDKLENLATQSNQIKVEFIGVVKEMATRQDHQSNRAAKLERSQEKQLDKIHILSDKLTRNNAYWSIVGAILLLIGSGVVKLMFFPTV